MSSTEQTACPAAPPAQHQRAALSLKRFTDSAGKHSVPNAACHAPEDRAASLRAA